MPHSIKQGNFYGQIDEADISGSKYINTLVGDMEQPETTSLLHCKTLAASPNHQTVLHAVYDAIRCLQTDGQFCFIAGCFLLLSNIVMIASLILVFGGLFRFILLLQARQVLRKSIKSLQVLARALRKKGIGLKAVSRLKKTEKAWEQKLVEKT